MSAVEREIELVAGTIGGITQKKADTWTVAVTPSDSQYAKNLWTKDVDLVESLSAKIGQAGAFVCGASYWERDGKQVRSLWIDSVENADAVEAVSSVATPVAAARPAAPQAKPSTDGMSKEEWARKDSAIHKMACIKTAADALKHTLPSDPSNDDLLAFLGRCSTLYRAWHRAVLAERDDPTGEDIPF
jgi:spore cortex formation protein SpoVR/YcgB (stage V sporulation)